jgi:CDP-diacylglycerol--serine O-phosphatidyltransferase
MSIKKHIPNAITCLNVFSGCVAVYLAFRGEYQGVLIAILLAAVFDFMDGLAARMLKAYSPMGKELDSLADVISFGLAPGALVFSLLTHAGMGNYVPFVGFVIPVFSALRLAKFNVDERQTTSFIGLPTPANAIFWVGMAFSYTEFLESQPWVLIGGAMVFSYLLLAALPMFSLKFKNLSWKDNQSQYLFLAGCVAILVVTGVGAFSFIIAWYILLSLLLWLKCKWNARHANSTNKR